MDQEPRPKTIEEILRRIDELEEEQREDAALVATANADPVAPPPRPAPTRPMPGVPKIRPAKGTLIPPTRNTPPPFPANPPGKIEPQKELGNLSKEDKEKIGWGLNVIGFNVEKKKNDFFATQFDKIVKSKKIEKGGTAYRFCVELRDSFIRDSKIAQEKANDAKSGKEKRRLANTGLLVGNVTRYARMLTDATGLSLASPTRYVMMAGMAYTRIVEAGKEARLKNEKVIEKTRIQDAEKAAQEAWAIYENAKKESKNGEVSAEALKESYLMNIPKELWERNENPNIANNFIQKVLKFDIDTGINNINNQIIDIEKDKKLSGTQKKEAIRKITKKYEKNLNDYDRILTQYGSVDALAMAGMYAQTAGKTVVTMVTLETLILSAEKVWGTVSNILSKSSDVHEAVIVAPSATEPTRPQPALPNTQSTTITPVTPTPEPTTQPPVSAPEAVKPVPVEALKTPTTTPGVATVVENIKTPVSPSHSPISNNFSLELGKNGVPKNLETVFTSISANHLNLPADANGIRINEEFATKSLNMGANLVRLTEGKDVAGIAQAEWNEAGNFWNGKLEIRNHEKFNAILSKLQENADKNWQAGILQSTGGASSYIGNINKDGWLKIVHGDGLTETGDIHAPTQTGITGHDQITKERIGDFKKVEHKIARTENNDALWGKLVEEKGTILDTDKLSYPSKLNVDANTPDTSLGTIENASIDEGAQGRINNLPTYAEHYASKTRAEEIRSNLEEHFSKKETPATRSIAPDILNGYSREEIMRMYPEFKNNPFKLDSDQLLETFKVYRENIRNLSQDDFDRNVWVKVRNMKATELFKDTRSNSRMMRYLHELRDITKEKPKGWSLFHRAETTNEYIMRVLQKATKMGKLDQFADHASNK